MKVQLDQQTNRILVDAAEFAGFARTRGGYHRGRLQFRQGEPCGMSCGGKQLSLDVNEVDASFTLTADVDLLYRDVQGGITVEKFRQVGRITDRTGPLRNPDFMAEGVLAAYLLCLEETLPFVHLCLTYVVHGKDESRSFLCRLEKASLQRMSEVLIARAVPFIAMQAQKLLCGRGELASMAFPYRGIRDGQLDFINDAYRCVKSGGALLVAAPTGIGKTISALYPALRALGSGHTDKIFYLTAKTVTGSVAAQACREMSAQVPSLRAVTVVSKEKTCLVAEVSGGAGRNLGRSCYGCPYLGEINQVSYEERRDCAMLELLENGHVIDTAMICSTAKSHGLCPYELSLDISEYCEVVICDYNYVFDPSVRFRRYFVDGTDRYTALIDEAHNLPDRAREMYSATLYANDFLRLYKNFDTYFPEHAPLREALGKVLQLLRDAAALCKGEEQLTVGGKQAGYYLSKTIPNGYDTALSGYIRVAGDVLRRGEDAGGTVYLERTLTAAASFLRSMELFDREFVFYAESVDGRLRLSIRCLDPSKLLSRMRSSLRGGTIFFSATLSPMEYFADVLGCSKAPQLELDSPYDPSHLGLFAVDSVSTRYGDRDQFCEEIAEMIQAAVDARPGHYIVYFPSYKYMRAVYQAFAELSPDTPSVVQKQGMRHEERQQFLASFSQGSRNDALVGFCVLGGAFAEGVDLRGEGLIGVIIVGTGLPGISAEQNILRDYFETTRENGYDYAYTYPAMIKVLQAAGRVIRGEEDRGVVILIDDRYGQPQTYRLFPKSWRHIRFCGDAYSLQGALEAFWERQER